MYWNNLTLLLHWNQRRGRHLTIAVAYTLHTHTERERERERERVRERESERERELPMTITSYYAAYIVHVTQYTLYLEHMYRCKHVHDVHVYSIYMYTMYMFTVHTCNTYSTSSIQHYLCLMLLWCWCRQQ